MVDVVAARAYRQQLRALLPAGRAWPRQDGTVLGGLVDTAARHFGELDRRAAALLGDVLPNLTTALLPDWERAVGLPDECSPLASTLAARRAALLVKLVAQPTLNSGDYKRIARYFGVDIEVEDLDRERAGTSTTRDTSDGKWRFVWWVTVPTTADVEYFDMLSDVNTPLLDIERHLELECRLQKAAPAHTQLVVGYNSIPMLPPLPAQSGTVGTAIDITLPAAYGGDTPLTYSVSGLPAGLVFDADTRKISGSPTAAEAPVVTYGVEDTGGDSDSGMFEFEIVEASG